MKRRYLFWILLAFIIPISILAQPPSDRKRAAKSSPSLSEQAKEIVRQVLENSSLTRCGDSYYSRSNVLDAGGVTQFKDPSFIIIDIYPLTSADKLNGITWKGRVQFRYLASRRYQNRWLNWQDYESRSMFTYPAEMRNSRWRTEAYLTNTLYRKINCTDLPGTFNTHPPVVPKPRPIGVIRVDSSKEPSICGPHRPFEQCKPDPTVLAVTVRIDNKVFLNNEPRGTLKDLSPLTRKLIDVFRERKQQRVFEPGTTEIISTVWISTDSADKGRQNSLTELDVRRIIRALKAAGANPIKITDRTPSLPDPPLKFDPNRTLADPVKATTRPE